MKKKENEIYFKWGLTAAVVLIIAIVCYFALHRWNSLSSTIDVARKILNPFLYGAIIAYLLSPMCGKIEGALRRLSKNRLRKGAVILSITFSLMMAILIVWVFLAIVLPQFWQSALSVANALPGLLRDTSERVNQLLENHEDLQEYWAQLSEEITNRIETWRQMDFLPLAQSVLSRTAEYVSKFVRVLRDLLLGLVISVYFLSTRKRFAAQAKMLLRGLFTPIWADRIEREFHYADRMFNGFFMGKLLDSVIVGVICLGGCLIMRLESPVLISVIVGVTNIIPFFGPFIGAVPCALLLLLINPMHCLMFLIFVVVLQQLDGNVIGPRVMGNTTGLSGFWVTFAILFFGGLMGVHGMIVGVPLFAVIYDVLRRLIHRGLLRHGEKALIDDYDGQFHPDGKE